MIIPGIAVIIPTWKPDQTLRKLLKRLMKQTVKPEQILLLNTEQVYFDEALVKELGDVKITVTHITKEMFDHGGTRRMGATMVECDILVYMTMDALPADTHLLEELIKPLRDTSVACAYARQLPRENADPLERYSRQFNYGSVSAIKTKDDLAHMGIKTYFCSNVCAAYRKDAYEAIGGFPERTLFNEDMIFAGHAITAGYGVAYCAKARVVHSHQYTGLQQLRRNFDLGVSQAQFPEVFSSVRSESEGLRLVKSQAKWLIAHHYAGTLPRLIWQSGCKYIGYRAGKAYKHLPKTVILRLTTSPIWWEKEN